jgi:CheY-like chemotaxis protein
LPILPTRDGNGLALESGPFSWRSKENQRDRAIDAAEINARIPIVATVLVVDDHRDANDILCRLLRLDGHRTVSAFTGEDALATLASQQADVVILDFMMPGMDGIETLRQIRSNPLTAALRVIMYTAVADPAFRDHALEKGANAYFAKGQMHFSQLRELIAPCA